MKTYTRVLLILAFIFSFANAKEFIIDNNFDNASMLLCINPMTNDDKNNGYNLTSNVMVMLSK